MRVIIVFGGTLLASSNLLTRLSSLVIFLLPLYSKMRNKLHAQFIHRINELSPQALALKPYHRSCLQGDEK